MPDKHKKSCKQPENAANIRTINLLNSQVSKHLSQSNAIVTAHYSLMNFIPKTIFEQFRQLWYLWYLFVIILELYFSGYTKDAIIDLVPFSAIFILRVLSDGYIDLKRHRYDNEINNLEFKSLSTEKIETKKSKNISVGDVLLINGNSKAPADLIVLCTCENKQEFHVDMTENIGEMQFDIKKPTKETRFISSSLGLYETMDELSKCNATIRIPEERPVKFSGSIKLRSNPKSTQLQECNYIKSGAKILNIDWIYAVVIYTNGDIKKNKKVIRRLSLLETRLNIVVFWMIAISLMLTFLSCMINIFGFSLKFGDDNLHFTINSILLFHRLVPPCLFICIKIFQLIFTLKISKKIPGIKFNTFDVCEELGQIEYIITDKTGTITSNNVLLPICILDGETYIRDRLKETEQYEESTSQRIMNVKNFSTFSDLKIELAEHKETFSPAYYFVMCMAVCNISGVVGQEVSNTFSIEDHAMAGASNELGVEVISRSNKKIKLDYWGTEVDLDIISSKGYSNKLQKSRIMVKDSFKGQNILYVKGRKAEMLRSFTASQSFRHYMENNGYETQMSGKKLIFVGYCTFTDVEIEEFKYSYKIAKASPVNSEGKIEDLFTNLELKLNFLGIIGLEDEVHEDTKEAVSLLSEAGIKFWMVSGDSEENSICTAISSKVIDSNTKIVMLNELTSELDCRLEMINLIKTTFANVNLPFNEEVSEESKESADDDDAAEEINLFATGTNHLEIRRMRRIPTIVSHLAHSKNVEMPTFEPPVCEFTDFSLCVDRSGLEYGLQSEENRKYFAILLCAAKSVCFYSLLPEDKTKIAGFLRYNFSYSPLFLAIGDGKSDLGMIQSAHVGIGLENSNFSHLPHISISKFSQIKELVLFQGHWNYAKISNVVLMIFFKNFLLVLILFFHCNASKSYGGSLFEPEMVAIYLFLFIMLPTVTVGIFDEDLERWQILKNPQVYSIYRQNLLLNYWSFLWIFLMALFQALIIYFPMYLIRTTDDQGFTLSLACMEWVLYFSMVGGSLLYVLVETRSLHKWTLLSYLISVISLVVYSIVLSNYDDYDNYGYLDVINGSPVFFLYILLTLMACFVIIYVRKTFRSLFVPILTDFIQSLKDFDLIIKLKSKAEIFKDNLDAIYKKTKYINQSTSTFEMSKWTLKFISKTREAEYMDEKKKVSSKTLRVPWLLLFVLIIGFLIDSYFKTPDQRAYLSFMCISIFIYCILITVVFSSYYEKYYKCIIIIIRTYTTVIVILLELVFEIFDPIVYTNISPLFTIGTSFFWFEMIVMSSISVPILTIVQIYAFIIEYSVDIGLIYAIEFMTILISIVLQAAVIGYFTEKSNRKRYVLMKKVEIEVEKSQQVLDVVLPAFVRKRVKDGIRYIAEDQGVVTVLFCEICQFEEIISAFPQSEVSYFIDDIYKKFDMVCESTGVAKIETVGKVYMACAGLTDSDAEMSASFNTVHHSRRAIEMGLGILGVIKQIRLRKPLQVKIGIHTGPVVAGIVGFHKPQFSLVGDTVNTASRMSTTIETPNSIQISEDTYSYLDDKSGLYFTKKLIEVKGKGTMRTFLVKSDELNDIKSGRRRTQGPAPLPNELKRLNTNSYNMAKNLFLTNELSPIVPTSGRKSSFHDSEFVDDTDYGIISAKLSSESPEPIKITSFIFSYSSKEAALRSQMLETNYPILVRSFLVLLFCNLTMTALSIAELFIDDHDVKYKFLDIFFYFAMFLAYGTLLFLFKNNYKSLTFAWVLRFTYSLSMIWTILINILQDDSKIEIIKEAYVLFMTLISSQCVCNFFKNTFLFTAFISAFHAAALLIIDPYYISHHVFFSIFFTIICLLIAYFRERDLRIFFASEEYSKKELKKTEDLLTQMMPPHVYHNLKEEVANTDSFNEVTILYADIAGFTLWSSYHNAKEVVGMLSELYTRFDRKCVENNVYKVHTIGDCYVAIGFLGTEERDPGEECLNIINFANSLNEIISAINQELFLNLGMRIGIHTGNIIGGIAGTSIVRYDIYGDDVLIANKMESSGVAGSINVSEATKNLIESYKPGMFTFNSHKAVEIESINRTVNSFLIVKN
ncbi:unnamed protein product [Blepharisma stoltei]|uniref:Guanylate cyclase domain-containing protein n=1 Tax=Blepharisma stoltei TaxID=1481888 RepID=A0AAU9J5Q2_9CILI|nr:unnamed protein product [Blepharisma stoltei]